MYVEQTATAPVPLVSLHVIFYSNHLFKNFIFEHDRLRETLDPSDDFYCFHNHYWRTHLKCESWSTAGTGWLRAVPNGAEPPLFKQLNPALRSPATEPNLDSKVEGYPAPRARDDPTRFLGKIERTPISLTQRFAAAYTIDNVVMDSLNGTAMKDATLVSFVEQVVPPECVASV